MTHRALPAAAALLLAAACSPVPGPALGPARWDKTANPAAVEDTAPPSGHSGGGIVFREEDLTTGASLLEALTGRVSSMRITRSGGCSRVMFRGATSIMGSSEAHVWVDGQAAGDSCILDLLRRGDVARVEIYPSGLVPRAGYPTSATGSILVFMKQSNS